ncbi:MAG: HNH endonuclease [Nitrosopumilus sp.]
MLNQEGLKEVLNYDKTTGLFYWKVQPIGRINVGDQAGSYIQGYNTIMFDGRNYRAHRLAFLWMTGSWPKEQIDHIDQNRANNSWSNLRECTNLQNQGNQKVCKNNVSGYKGVSWHTQRNCWRAQIGIQENGKNRSKHLGVFTDLKDAVDAYNAAAIEYFGEFAHIQEYREEEFKLDD